MVGGAVLAGWLLLAGMATGAAWLYRRMPHWIEVRPYLFVGGCYATWSVVDWMLGRARAEREVFGFVELLYWFLFIGIPWPYIAFMDYGLSH